MGRFAVFSGFFAQAGALVSMAATASPASNVQSACTLLLGIVTDPPEGFDWVLDLYLCFFCEYEGGPKS